jgi:hypothetical protein
LQRRRMISSPGHRAPPHDLVLTRQDYEVTRGGVERLGALGVEVEEIRRGADRTRRNSNPDRRGRSARVWRDLPGR